MNSVSEFSHVVYLLVDPRTACVRYVGITKKTPKRRLQEHIAQAPFKCTSHRAKWLVSLRKAGVAPRMLVVDYATMENWADRERFWIAHYRAAGCALVNTTDGGQGNPGYKPSDESRRKMSEAHMGQKWKPDRKPNPKHGPPMPPQTMAAIRASRLGAKHSPEALAKMSEKQKGRVPSSAEVREKQRQALLNHFENIRERPDLYPDKTAQGERNGKSKLTEATVRDMRTRFAAGGITKSALAAEHGVEFRTVSDVIARKTWKHVG